MSLHTPFLSSVLIITLCVTASAQTTTKPPHDWFLRDPETDQLQGVSAERAYNTVLKGLPSRQVVVAVVDTGVDIEHEDLKSVIWTNEGEIPGNGIDDDKNGYVDDIHGWNFIGGKDGNVTEDTGEITREYARLSKMFAHVEEDKVSKKQRSEYENYKKIKDRFEKAREENQKEYDLYRTMYSNLKMSVDTLKGVMHTDKLTLAKVDSFKSTNPTLAFAKGFTTHIMKRMGDDGDIDEALKELEDGVKHYKVVVEYNYNPEYDSRLIVGDDYNKINERHYGNNDVAGPDPDHGTHVAGIIGADRSNDLGIKGIADNVRIMSVRAVPPNGDERDKDVANAIRYAVDNGAKIINMSFGKSYSPGKEAVDEAVRYAEKKGVLFIHAAGNDGQDIDTQRDYPSRYYLDGKESQNWLEVGASSWGKDESFVARFSNYGKKSVDVFAPGVEIFSTVAKNKYENESGTSMSSPTTAGVAALLMSYFPELTSTQIRDILKKSTRKFDGLKVRKPGGGKADFADLSNTGGMVNAYEAVMLALSLQVKKVER